MNKQFNRYKLAIFLILASLITSAQTYTNKTSNVQYIIKDIEPANAIVKIDGVVAVVGFIFYGNQEIDLPCDAVIRYKHLGLNIQPSVEGGKLLQLEVKTLDNYNQLNSKGSNDFKTKINRFSKTTWLMISDTAFLQFPEKLNHDEFFTISSTNSRSFTPAFNYDNSEITITKSDLINIGAYNENDSIIQLQLNFHDAIGSLNITENLHIRYISHE